MKQIFFLILLFAFSLILALLLFKHKKIEVKGEIKFECPYSYCKKELFDDYQEYQKRTNLPLKDAIIRTNIGLNNPFYTNTKESKLKNSLYILVNKYNYLTKDYIPNNLTETKEYSKSILKMNSKAYDAFKEMAKEIEKEDMHIRIVSAYRSYDYQNNLYNNYLKYDTKEKVDTYSARAGYSEHQTGLAVDIDNTLVNYNRFHITQEFTWMQKNAYKYGFILRYPLGKENITGYKYEPWHYRYVGKDIAKYIHDNDITYEEYYYEFIDN